LDGRGGSTVADQSNNEDRITFFCNQGAELRPKVKETGVDRLWFGGRTGVAHWGGAGVPQSGIPSIDRVTVKTGGKKGEGQWGGKSLWGGEKKRSQIVEIKNIKGIGELRFSIISFSTRGRHS